VWSPRAAFSIKRSYHDEGRHSGVKKTIERVWPKEYSCRPVDAIAVKMDALWMVRVGMERFRARRSRSVCVVAPSGSPTTRNAMSAM